MATGISLTGAAFVNPRFLFKSGDKVLDQAFIKRHKSLIEKEILSAMEAVYLPYEEVTYIGGSLEFEGVRSDPRFKAILEKIGLE
jgi:hypothetical protein